MTHFSYEMAKTVEPRIGLIVLQADESLERDLRQIFPSSVNLLVSRVPSGEEVTPRTLNRMAEDLPAAARLLPQAQDFAVVGYGCTSGAAVIGRHVVAELVRRNVPTANVTDPVTALVAACAAMKITRLGILSPYVAAVSATLQGVLASEGIATPVFGSFDEAVESRVVRISPVSIMAAAETLVAGENIDALFMSCTNLRTFDVIESLESRIGLPVLSSNQVLGWHLMRSAGLTTQMPGLGALLCNH